MPTYAYHCPAGHEFERFERKISNKSRVKCPECGKMATRAVSGGTGFLLKGSGFYATDYKKAAVDAPGDKDAQGDKKDKADKPEKKDGPDAKSATDATKPGKSSGAGS